MVRRFRTTLLGGELRRGIITLVGGTVLGRAVIVGSSPIITRLFVPTEVGEFATVLSIVGILIVLGDLSYSAAIVLPEDDAEGLHVLALSLITVAGTAVVVATVLAVAGSAILGIFGVSSAAGYGVVIVAAQLLGGAAIAFGSWGTRLRRFRPLAIADAVQSATTVVVQILFGLAALGAAGLLGGWVVGAVVGLILLMLAGFRGTGVSFRGLHLHEIVAAARRYRRFPFLTMPSSFLNTLGLRTPLLLLVLVYGADVGGHFALAERVAFLPITVIAIAVGNVYQVHAAPMARMPDDSLRRLYVHTTKRLAIFGLPVALAIAILSPLLFGIIFGQDWVEAGVFAAILSPWFFAQLVTNPTGRTLDLLERQDIHFRRELIRMAILGIAALGIVIVHPPPVGAVAILTIAGCLTYGQYGYATWRAITSERPRPAVRPTQDASTPDG